MSELKEYDRRRLTNAVTGEKSEPITVYKGESRQLPPDGFFVAGVMAIRDPGTKEFLPAEPLFIMEASINEGSQAEEERAGDVAKIIAPYFKNYMEGLKAEKRRQAIERKKREKEAKQNDQRKSQRTRPGDLEKRNRKH